MGVEVSTMMAWEMDPFDSKASWPPPDHVRARPRDKPGHDVSRLGNYFSSASPKPAASMARWVLFWKLASCPAARSGAASAIARQTASTQPASYLAKSLRT